MLVFNKVKRINLNNTKYYLIASYLLGKPTNNRARKKIQQSLMKCIKDQNWLGTKLINWDSSWPN